MRAAEIAIEEINGAGGILGKKVEMVWRDTISKPDVAVKGAAELIDTEGVKMVFGGVSSGVAVAVGEVCQQKGVVYMASITASNETTVEKGHRHTFRPCFNAWMNAKALSSYLNKHYAGKKYFYVTSDYTWGWSTEESIRKFTGTEDQAVHKRVLTALGAEDAVFEKAIAIAEMVKPDVLVLVLFGKDMSTAVRLATMAGLKSTSQIVVPILELNLTEGTGPKVMEGVIGISDWNWDIPYKYNYEKGKALEGNKFTLIKDEQMWRDFDHQCVQSVHIVKCKPEAEVLKNKFKLDFFEILDKQSGEALVQTRDEWSGRRQAAGAPASLEKLPGE